MKLLSVILVMLLSVNTLASGWGSDYPDIPYCEDELSNSVTPNDFEDYYGLEYCMDENSDEVEYREYYEQNANLDRLLKCEGQNVEVSISFTKIGLVEGVNLLNDVDVKVSVKNDDKGYIFENETFTLLKSNTYILREIKKAKINNKLTIATSVSTSKKFSFTGFNSEKAFKSDYRGSLSLDLKKGPLNYSIQSMSINCKFITE